MSPSTWQDSTDIGLLVSLPSSSDRCSRVYQTWYKCAVERGDEFCLCSRSFGPSDTASRISFSSFMITAKSDLFFVMVFWFSTTMKPFYRCNKEENGTADSVSHLLWALPIHRAANVGIHHASSPEPRSRLCTGSSDVDTSVQEELYVLHTSGPLRRVQQSYARVSPITSRARPTTTRNLLSPSTIFPQSQLPPPGPESSSVKNDFTVWPSGSTVVESATAIRSVRRPSITDDWRVDIEDLDCSMPRQVFFMKETDASSVPAVTWVIKVALIAWAERSEAKAF